MHVPRNCLNFTPSSAPLSYHGRRTTYSRAKMSDVGWEGRLSLSYGSSNNWGMDPYMDSYSSANSQPIVFFLFSSKEAITSLLSSSLVVYSIPPRLYTHSRLFVLYAINHPPSFPLPFHSATCKYQYTPPTAALPLFIVLQYTLFFILSYTFIPPPLRTILALHVPVSYIFWSLPLSTQHPPTS